MAIHKVIDWKLSSYSRAAGPYAVQSCTLQFSYDFQEKIGNHAPELESSKIFNTTINRWSGNLSDTELMFLLGDTYSKIPSMHDAKVLLTGLFYDNNFLETLSLGRGGLAILYVRTATGRIINILLKYYAKEHVLLLDCCEFGGRYPFTNEGVIITLS